MIKKGIIQPKPEKFSQGDSMVRLFRNFKDLYRYRVLITNLVSRELKARYRGTILGFFWSFFNPFLLMVVYSVVFGLIIQPRDPNIGSPLEYALFLFCGVLPWTWFSSSMLESAYVLMIQGYMIKKILFPVEILPIVVASSNLVHFFLGLPILLIFVPVVGKSYSIYLAFLPVVIFVQLVFTLGLSFFVSSLTVHFRDIKDILTNFLTFWFFASPIIYTVDLPGIKDSSLMQTFLTLNPITHIMQGYQSCVFLGELIHWKRLGVTFILSLILLYIGYATFDRLRDSFPEEV
jgi:ABC-type polysaccharide/polyol phosphate export permease